MSPKIHGGGREVESLINGAGKTISTWRKGKLNLELVTVLHKVGLVLKQSVK